LTRKNQHCLGVMIAKKESTRLIGKNTKTFNGSPMFLWNLKKLVDLFGTVVFDSDCAEMCKMAREMGAKPHLRPMDLRGNDIPSVPLFKSISDEYPHFDSIVNVQANSPNTSEGVIQKCGEIIRMPGVREVLTSYSSREINGSVWCFNRSRLNDYGDYYVHYPDVLVIDDSIDIHTEEEFLKALNEK
jgi:CMP-N-acetylneuraminic acid synthetase